MVKEFHNGITVIAKALNLDITPVVEKWVEIYTKRRKAEGKVSALKFMKALNTCCERYALYQPIEPIPWTKSNVEGFPRCINMVKPYLRSENTLEVMLTLSVFRTIEMLRLPISKDISTVIDEPKFDNSVVESIIDFIPTFVKGLKPLKLGELKYHFSLKSGPNGPALKTSDLDSNVVLSDKPLRKAIREVERQLNDKVPSEMRGRSREGLLHSKLVQLPEKSGKTRTIAIVDYYSQRCLRPLHESLMALLRTIESDGTFSHSNVGNYARALTLSGSYAYCADLTAFTDRFPAVLQEHLLKELLNNDNLADAFWTLLAKRQFTVAWSGEKVEYKAGQPMGCYASWPLCTLAHHLVVQYCAHIGKVADVKTKYRMIGDDLILSDQVIASNYRNVINSLGVSINVGKTVESIPNNHNCAEVAKQLYLNGKCLTPITPGIVKDLMKPYMFNTCIGILKSRYDLQPEVYPMLIETLYKYRSRARKLVWILVTEPLDGYIRPGMPGYDEFCPWLLFETANYRNKYVGIYFAKFQNKADELYADLLEYLFFRDGPLGNRARSQRPTFAVEQVLKELKPRFERLSHRDQYCKDQDDLMLLADEFACIPDPHLAFMDRKEVRNKRLSSIVEYVYTAMSSEFEVIR